MIEKLFTIKGHGPILITAPHTIKTIRKSKYIQKKETYINNIKNKIYNKLGPELCTLLTWDIDYIKKYGLFPKVYLFSIIIFLGNILHPNVNFNIPSIS